MREKIAPRVPNLPVTLADAYSCSAAHRGSVLFRAAGVLARGAILHTQTHTHTNKQTNIHSHMQTLTHT